MLIICKSGEDGKEAMQETGPQLVLEALAAMIAGYALFLEMRIQYRPAADIHRNGDSSDTTAVTLSNLWYYLLSHPAYYKRLRQEVDAVFLRGEDPTDQERLVGMEYFNACINETLRLAPPVPSGSQRGVPPSIDGKLVGSQSVSELSSPDSFVLLMCRSRS